MEGLWQKLDCVDFVSFLLSFDVVCLTETFIDTDFQSDMFKDYLSFTAKAKKLSRHGRNSGGYVMLIKKLYAELYERSKFLTKTCSLLK